MDDPHSARAAVFLGGGTPRFVRPLRVWIAAGEASGDLLASGLMAELRARGHDLIWRGLAGPSMRRKGVHAVARSEEATALGLVEVVSAIPKLWALSRRLRADLRRTQPDLVVTIDSPGLLLPLARYARQSGAAVVHWGSPQIWAWRSHRRHQVAQSVDVLLCQLPFEADLYRELPLRTSYVGHPAWDLQPGKDRPAIAFLPGSRPNEIRRMAPLFGRVAREVQRQLPDHTLLTAVAPTSPTGPDDWGWENVQRVDSVADLAGVRAAVVASGTATLELAAMQVPMVVSYQLHPVTWFVARQLVEVPWAALPNLIGGAAVVPEVLQTTDASLLADIVVGLARRPDASRRRLAALRRRSAGPTGAIARAADEVERLMARAQ